MESLLRDLGDARDANNLPFDDALRDNSYRTGSHRGCSASRAHVGDEAAGQEVGGIGRQKDPSIKTRRQAALTAMLRVVDRLPARGPSQGRLRARVALP